MKMNTNFLLFIVPRYWFETGIRDNGLISFIFRSSLHVFAIHTDLFTFRVLQMIGI